MFIVIVDVHLLYKKLFMIIILIVLTKSIINLAVIFTHLPTILYYIILIHNYVTLYLIENSIFLLLAKVYILSVGHE